MKPTTSSKYTKVNLIRDLMNTLEVSMTDLILVDIVESMLEDQGAYLRDDGSDLDSATAFDTAAGAAEVIDAHPFGHSLPHQASTLDQTFNDIRAELLDQAFDALRPFAAD